MTFHREDRSWHPIETAPASNGSAPFLMFIPGAGQAVGHRLKISGDNGCDIIMSKGKLITKATHWMPLPPAPEVNHG